MLRFEGQLSTFKPHAGGPCYRCLYPEPPPEGLVPSCAEAGVLGAVTGVMGTLQATEVLKELLGIGEGLSGRLLIWDALAARFREVRLRRDPDCALCGAAATIRDLSAHASRRLRSVPPDPGAPDGGPLAILLLSGTHERAHYAFVLAAGAAALGRRVTLFATNGGARALLADWSSLADAGRDAAIRARGVAGLDELREAARELGVRSARLRGRAARRGAGPGRPAAGGRGRRGRDPAGGGARRADRDALTREGWPLPGLDERLDLGPVAK